MEIKLDNVILSDYFANLKSFFKEKMKKDVLGFSLFPTLYDGVFRLQVITDKNIYENLVCGEYLNSVNGGDFKELKNGK